GAPRRSSWACCPFVGTCGYWAAARHPAIPTARAATANTIRTFMGVLARLSRPSGRQLVQVVFQVRVPVLAIGRAVRRVLGVEAVGLLPLVRAAVVVG